MYFFFSFKCLKLKLAIVNPFSIGVITSPTNSTHSRCNIANAFVVLQELGREGPLGSVPPRMGCHSSHGDQPRFGMGRVFWRHGKPKSTRGAPHSEKNASSLPFLEIYQEIFLGYPSSPEQPFEMWALADYSGSLTEASLLKSLR